MNSIYFKFYELKQDAIVKNEFIGFRYAAVRVVELNSTRIIMFAVSIDRWIIIIIITRKEGKVHTYI